jgi:hypothetical protein
LNYFYSPLLLPQQMRDLRQAGQPTEQQQQQLGPAAAARQAEPVAHLGQQEQDQQQQSQQQGEQGQAQVAGEAAKFLQQMAETVGIPGSSQVSREVSEQTHAYLHAVLVQVGACVRLYVCMRRLVRKFCSCRCCAALQSGPF